MARNDREFFNKLAATWDETRSHNPVRLERLIGETGIHSGQFVLDVGCGTGVLFPYLIRAVGETGSVVGIDIADNMIALASKKLGNLSNSKAIRADVMEFQPETHVDHVTCLNFFPHLHNQSAFLQKVMNEWLASGGWLHIFHDISRAQVNAIHGECSVVKDDRLPECGEIGKLLATAGFVDVRCFEDETCYFVQGKKGS